MSDLGIYRLGKLASGKDNIQRQSKASIELKDSVNGVS